MTDKVNWNPFTNQSLTTEQIEILDTNGDGTVSDFELTSKWSWLSQQSVDVEPTYKTSKQYNIVLTDKAEFYDCANLILETYIENFYINNHSLPEEDINLLLGVISSEYKIFVNDFLSSSNNSFDMSVFSTRLSEKLDEKVDAFRVALSNVNTVVQSNIENLDNNKSTMLTEAYVADENGYVTNEEYLKVKNATINYLMSAFLAGNIDEDLMSNLIPNYKSNKIYKNILSLVNQLNSSVNPDDKTMLLEKIKETISSLVSDIPPEKCVRAVNAYAKSEGEKAVTNILNQFIEAYLEEASVGLSDNDRAELRKFVQICRDKFLASIVEDGSIDTLSETALKTSFNDYIVQQGKNLLDVQTELFKQTTEIETSFATLVSVADNANANNYISIQERTDILEATKNLLLSQLLSGMTDLELLKKLGANSDLSKMTALVSKIWAESDPDKLADYKTQLEDLITKTLDKFSNEKLLSAIKSIQPVIVSDLTKDKTAVKSSISDDYFDGKSRSTSYGKQNEKSLEQIQEMAKKDLDAYVESLRAQLKAELGENYNSAEIEKYIKDAMQDTISYFTRNIVRRNQHGNYNTATDKYAFVFARRSGSHKGRYVYNVTALIDKFVEFFNETSKFKNLAKIDSTKATYDRENVVVAALGNEYDRNKSEKIYAHKDDKETYAKLIEQAKEDLKLVAKQVKLSLKEEGVPIDMSKVDAWLDELIMETIQDMKNAFQYCQPSGKNTNSIIGISNSISTSLAGAGIATYATPLLVTAATESALAADAAWSFAFSQVAVDNGLGWTAAYTSAQSASATAATAATASSVVPIVGWAIAGAALLTAVLGMTTNIFGSTYGCHDSEAGFYFERKSHSKSGHWGYDTGTLVNVFLAKVDAKLREEKEAYKNRNNPVVS